MTQPALSRLEAGGVIPTIPLLDRISAALDADLIVQIAPARRIALVPTADDSVPRWWSSSAPGECLGEHRKIAVMSEAQSCELVLLEPPDGIVFVQRDIVRSSRPTLDQPDLHVERIGMDLQDGPAGAATSIPSSSCNSRASAAPGSSPGSTCPPGRSHTSGYQRRWGDR